MALDKDYVLGIAVQLQDESIAAFERNLQARLERAFPGLKILATMEADQVLATSGRVTESLEKTEGAAKALNDTLRSSGAAMGAVSEGAAEASSAVEKLNVTLRSTDPILSNLREKIASSTVGINQEFEKREQSLDRYVQRIDATTAAQARLNAEQDSFLKSSSGVTHLLGSMGNMATWMVGGAAIFGAGAAIGKGFQDAIHSQQEQVIQGFYYKAQGNQFTPQMSSQTMSAAIDLARKYGDSVMQVQEAIGLWGKATKGEIIPSLEMADEALKLNSVTGMSNEEIYRSTVAVLSQYHEAIGRSNDLYNIGVGLAQKYGGGIKMLGGEAQDAARQMIEAMDTSSAVAASFGLSMEQSAGMATALIHAGNYDSGKSAGEAISRSLAALERGKPEQAMTEMGIGLHNNSKILDELVAKWNTEVPGMGKSLGDVITSSVQSSALEPLKLMINQIGLVKQATKEAYEYEKSHPLDVMYGQMKETDAYKINQLKASFEAISITIARQFLPAMQEGMDGFEKFVPIIIAAGPEIGDFAKTLAMLGAGWGAIEVIKLLGSATAAAGRQWGQFAAFYKADAAAMATASQAASVALTTEQSNAIATLTGNATVTAEMSAQWRSLAASQGVSVDQMIASMAKLRADTQEGAASIVLSEDSMSTNMKLVADQLGVEEVQVVAAFDGMATGAESAASVMRTAFMGLIPVIGQVLLLAGLAKMAYDGIHDNMSKADAMNYESNPYARRMREISLNHSIADDTTELQGDQKALQAYMARGMDTRGIAGLIAGVKSRLAGEHSELQDLISGHAWTKYESVDQQLAAEKAGLQKALNQKVVPPGFDESGTPAAPPDKGQAKDYSALAESIVQVTDKTALYVDAQKLAVMADDSHIRVLEKKLKITPENVSLLQKISALNDDRNAALGREDTSIQSNIGFLIQQRDQAEQLANSYNKGSTEQEGYLSVAHRLNQEIISQKNALQQNQGQIDQNNASMQTYVQTLTSGMTKHLDQDYTNLGRDKKFSAKFNDLNAINSDLNRFGVEISKIMPLIKDPDVRKFLNDFVGNENKRYASEVTNTNSANDLLVERVRSSTSSYQSKAYDSVLSMSGMRPEDIAYLKQMEEISKEYVESQKEYQEFLKSGMGKDDPFVQQWVMTRDAALEAERAAAQYQLRLTQIQQSPEFNAIIAAFNSLGSSFTSAFDNSLNAAGNSRIQGLQGKISQIDFENSMLSQGPFAKYNTFQEYMNKRDAENLQKRIDDMKNSMDHPNAFKKMFEAAEKSLADTFVKKVEDSFKNSITQSLMKAMFPDAAKTAADQQFTATTDLNTSTTTLNQTLTQTNNLLATGSGSFASGSGGGPTSISQLLAGAGAASSAFSSSGGGGGGSFNFASAPGVPSGLAASSSQGFPSNPGTNAMLAATAIGGAGGLMSFASGGGIGGVGRSGSPQAGIALGQPGSFDPQLAQAYVSQGMSVSDAISMASYQSASSAGYHGSAQHDMAAAAGLITAYQGYQQGGFQGSLMSGLGMYESLTSMGVPPQIAIPVAAVDFLASLFHPHYNPSTNPDMYADDGYAQGVADAQGSAYTQANGWVQENSGLKQQLGGMSQLQYLTSWYNKYPGGTGLNSSAKELWNQIGTLTGNGKGLEVRGLHQGNVYVSLPGHDAQVGMSGNWQDVLQTIDSDTQALYTLLSSDQSMNTPMISVNAYGGGGSSVGFSPWYTPGLTSSEIDAITNAPYSPGSVSSTAYGSPSSGAGGGGYGGAGGGGGYGGGGTNVINTNLYLDGSVVAQSVNSYRYQGEAAGFAPNTY